MTNGHDSAYATAGQEYASGGFTPPSAGLTKREYFAAMVLPAVLAKVQVGVTLSKITEDAVAYADGLIEALNKEQS